VHCTTRSADNPIAAISRMDAIRQIPDSNALI
jgi:hypothetical protein